MQPRYVLRLGNESAERARRAAGAVLSRSIDRLLPDGVLRESGRRSRLACGVRRRHRRVLAFSQAVGNDLSTPMPQHGFAGLSEGDQWCLCAARWQEALEAGAAPKVRLAATHLSALEYSTLADLRAHAVDV